MGFVVEQVTLGQVFLQVLQFSPVSIIPQMLHVHSHTIWGLDNWPVSGPFPQRHSLTPLQQQQQQQE
jgi:hypothetical protein